MQKCTTNLNLLSLLLYSGLMNLDDIFQLLIPFQERFPKFRCQLEICTEQQSALLQGTSRVSIGQMFPHSLNLLRSQKPKSEARKKKINATYANDEEMTRSSSNCAGFRIIFKIVEELRGIGRSTNRQIHGSSHGMTRNQSVECPR